jgi:hypothetical protein
MNPEFQRNLWLEISPARLVLMPAVLSLIGLLVVVLNPDDPQRSLFVAFSVLFVALTAGWGSLLVVSSIQDEVLERTWDQQRLSALGPWEMAWGKLLGSAVYAWYGGAWCALVAVVAALSGPAFWSRCAWLLVGALAVVALHAWLMASRLHTLDIRSEKAGGMAGRLMGLFLMLQTLPLIFMVLRDPTSAERDVSGTWWGLGWPFHLQSLVVAALALALGLLALWRSMAKQLMVRAVPWAWVLGILGVGWVLAGFVSSPGVGASLWMVWAGTALVATYGALFTEPGTRLVWQAVLFHWVNSPARRLWQALPLWPLSWGLAAVCVLMYALLEGSGSAAHGYPAASVMLLGLLHVLRDCGIYHFFAFRRTGRKPAGMTLLTLFVLGVVLPGVVVNAVPELALWLEPLFGLKDLAMGARTPGAATWMAMVLHLLVVGGLVVWRWHAQAPEALRTTARTA